MRARHCLKNKIWIWLCVILLTIGGIFRADAVSAAGGTDYSAALTNIASAVKKSAGAASKDADGSLTAGPFYGSTCGEWAVLGEARYGMADTTWYENYKTNLLTSVISVGAAIDGNSASSWKLHATKSTDNSRVVLALTSIGANPTNFGGYNLLAPLADMSYVKKQGINGAIFALLALDAGNYDVPTLASGTQTTREGLVSYLLEKELTGGGFALTGSTADVDVTAMALTALAPYNQTNTKISATLVKKVQRAVDRALTVLSGLQTTGGTFGANYGGSSTQTAESTAQVVTALSALHIDCATDSRFVKSGGSALSGLLSFYLADSGMCAHIAGGSANQMATEQAFYALVAYDRYKNGKNSLYDMTDVTLTDATIAPGAAKLTSAENEKKGVRITWTSVSTADGYVIYRKKASGAWKEYKTVEQGTTVSYTDTKVSNGVRYTYKICAKRGEKLGKSANQTMIYRLKQLTAKTTGSGTGKIKVTWKKNAKATGYQIRYSRKTSFSEAKTITIKKKGTVRRTLTGLKKKKTYYIQVRAYKTIKGKKYYGAWSKTYKVKA